MTTAIAVSLVPSGARVPVAWCGVAATVAVGLIAGETARRGRVIATLRHQKVEQEAELQRRLIEQETEMIRLAEVLLPDAVARLQQGELGEEVLGTLACGTRVTPQFEAAHRAVLRSVVDAVVAEEELRESAQRAFVNIARRVQAIVHQQAQDLRDMEDRHGQSPDVFGDLLHLDHGTALIGRLADSIAVLGGARPGRQWMKAVPLFSVLRGAMSRILDYQRVELHSVAEVAVVGPAAEPLIHALAELLDNATRYSPPQTRVHLTAIEVQAGVAVEIEDGGVGLTDEARARAERVLSQASSSGIDLTDLGETPRLGLAVVGRLAQANNFHISLRPSAYAGVRAVVVVPRELITERPAPTSTVPRFGAHPAVTLPRPKAVTNGAQMAEEPVAPSPQRSTNGLPQRRRHSAPAVARAGAAPGADPANAPKSSAPADSVQPGMWLAAFQSGVSGEKPTGTPVRGNGDETLDESESP